MVQTTYFTSGTRVHKKSGFCGAAQVDAKRHTTLQTYVSVRAGSWTRQEKS